MEEFAAQFGEVPDPRARTARHDFLEVIFIALAAVLCGAEDCTDMATFARSKLALLTLDGCIVTADALCRQADTA